MNWTGLQEAVTALGAGAGVVALAWNGVAEWRSRQAKRSSQITADMTDLAFREMVTVDFSGAERHTSYTLTVSCRRPRALHAQIITIDREGLPDVSTDVVQPFSIAMKPLDDQPGVVRAVFVPHGYSRSETLWLTFKIREGFRTRVVARRKLPMTIP